MAATPTCKALGRDEPGFDIFVVVSEAVVVLCECIFLDCDGMKAAHLESTTNKSTSALMESFIAVYSELLAFPNAIALSTKEHQRRLMMS